jgi:uncharacterized protein
MFGRLLPRETSFFDFFERHAALITEGTKEFALLAKSEGSGVVSHAKRIKELEHETDVITHHCVEALHKTFITPLDREDIHRLISRMDDIMDLVDAAAARIVLYEVGPLTQEVCDLADVLVRASEGVAKAVTGLRNMKNTNTVMKVCIDINRLENEGDSIYHNAVARLFREEKDPIRVIKWKEIYENLEAATDRCEDVANIIEGVVLENA